MEKKQKVDTGVALSLLLISIILLIIPLFNFDDLNIIIPTIFGLYAIIHLVQYILTKESKDNESICTSVVSIALMILSLLIELNNTYKTLALTLMIWVSLISLIKLKKVDYYHDKKDRMWKVNAMSLAIFILSGLLTCINLPYDSTVRIIIIGFFLFINALLKLIDPIIKTLIKHS
ncbi:MAG: hypothetical protein ACI4WW_01680 [Candidatus Coprovivens sp.]